MLKELLTCMIGKIRKKLLITSPERVVTPAPLICPICDRLIPESQKDAHHLIPKSKGGVFTLYLHRICHKQIHSLFNENQLAKIYNTPQALKTDADMQKFITWVKSKPNSYYTRTSKSNRIKL